MNLAEKKKEFIEAWGVLGPKWGINKTMAHIHALLLVCEEPICAKEIKEQLDISIGNVNQNLRCLVSWELAKGISKDGERKEYFRAEKDMWKALTCIIRKRRESELVPLLELLENFKNSPTADHEDNVEASFNFNKTMGDISMFAEKADGMLDKFISAENSWLLKGYRMMIR